MPTINDPEHPMYISEANRKIAQERANAYVGMISDYLAVKDAIPTGRNCQVQNRESKKKVLKVLNGSDKDWDNWKWHLKHSIRDVEILSKIIFYIMSLSIVYYKCILGKLF